MSVLKADGLVFSYDGKTDCIKDVSLSVDKGQMIAILGANGSGKSTLAKLLSGLAEPDSGTVSYHGIDNVREKVAIVFQNPDNQFSESTLYDELLFICQNFSIRDANYRILSALKSVGLADRQMQNPSTLSGGEKARLLIASALIRDPYVIILDEAFSMLDHDTAASCISLISGLKADHSIAVINITHNTEEILASDCVYLVSGGTVIKSGSPDEVLRDADSLVAAGVSPLPATSFAMSLRYKSEILPLTIGELVEDLCS